LQAGGSTSQADSPTSSRRFLDPEHARNDLRRGDRPTALLGRSHAKIRQIDAAASGAVNLKRLRRGAPAPGWAPEQPARCVVAGASLPIPSPSTRASPADQAHGVKIVQPVGCSTLTPWGRARSPTGWSTVTGWAGRRECWRAQAPVGVPAACPTARLFGGIHSRSRRHRHAAWPALLHLSGLLPEAFQAGHEGSIPFARSNQKSQVIRAHLSATLHPSGDSSRRGSCHTRPVSCLTLAQFGLLPGRFRGFLPYLADKAAPTAPLAPASAPGSAFPEARPAHAGPQEPNGVKQEP
jgi:hypothetical protein